MALIPWQPVDASLDRRGAGNPMRRRRWIPPMDLIETEDDLLLRVDLPGLSDEDVSVEVVDDVLTVSGRRTTEREEHADGYHRVERASGSFARSLMLPQGVDAEAVKASFDRGVLEVRIPKPQERKPQRVPISVGDAKRNRIEGDSPHHRRRPRASRLLSRLRS